MIFPEYLPPVLLEASAQSIQPPKTLTSIVLPVSGKTASNAAFSIILYSSVSSPTAPSSKVVHKVQDFFLSLLSKS